MKKKSTSPSGFLSLRAITILFCATAACSVLTVPLLAFLRPQEQVNGSQRTLSFEERVSYQKAIEEVSWRHRIWPKERPDPKPSLDSVMSSAQLEKKVTDYLRNSQALENYWQRPITAEQLQAEMDRMAKHTKQPEVLRELVEALGNDPFVIAECLARPALAERLITNWYAYDQRIHGDLKQRAEADLQAHPTVEQMKQLSGKYSEIEFVQGYNTQLKDHRSTEHGMKLNSREWDATVQELAAMFGDAGHGRLATSDRRIPTSVPPVKEATSDRRIPGELSPLQEDEDRYHVTAVIDQTKDRLKLATVEWPKEPFDSWRARAENQVPIAMAGPTANYTLPKISEGAGGCIDDTWTATDGPPIGREGHTAVWTGSEMIVWGGYTFISGSGYLNTGGRYNPGIDSWTATSTINAPTARFGHTAVWTGSEMIVWGGNFGDNAGGRYNPGTDSWTATATVNAPTARSGHTAVWTGSEMIIWGGIDNSGGRYNPNTDSWTATSTTNAPAGRYDHTAVWTGSEMIVWGGIDDSGFAVNTGGKYDPDTNSWIATTTNNAPNGRQFHTTVWTGSEMIVWGGYDESLNYPTIGGRYNPSTNAWTTTTTNNAPTGRKYHTAVWTGGAMIVWGGDDSSSLLNTGGRYNPITNSWTATSTAGAPVARNGHTTVWSGTEMIVWGGNIGPYPYYPNTEVRYNPTTDSWITSNVPSERRYHTAVWTGSEMIVWGGSGGFNFLGTGGRYDPSTDSWAATSTTNAPAGRELPTGVWTGTEMIVWGGYSYDGVDHYWNTGGKYNPSTDFWTATNTTNAPAGRDSHQAVWADNEMIVWGGYYYDGNDHYLNTGGRYNPSTNSWAATGTMNAPSARASHKAVWTGIEMIVWGGGDGVSYLNTGGRYDPETNSWMPMNTTGAPSARTSHTATWSGSEMIIWGGYFFDGTYHFLDTGGRYNPTTNSWTPTSIPNAPDGRALHTAVWTGSEMIVWGGLASEDTPYFDSGGKYDPGTDSWTATSTTNAPGGRYRHTAVWTDREMIVWAGTLYTNTITNTGGRYCAQSGPTPTPTPCTGRCGPTPRPRPTPRVRPSPPP